MTCEHIIGIKQMDYVGSNLIANNYVLLHKGIDYKKSCESIELFNFCPLCGKKLNIFTEAKELNKFFQTTLTVEE